MPRFKILRGGHSEGGKHYNQGDVVDSKIDLVKRCNKPGSIKFQALPDLAPTSSVAVADAEESDEYTRDELEAMTVVELKTIAESLDIDLGSAVKKTDIINTLLS